MYCDVCCAQTRQQEKEAMKTKNMPLESELAKKKNKDASVNDLASDNFYESDDESHLTTDEYLLRMRSELQDSARENRLGKTVYDFSMLAAGIRQNRSDGIEINGDLVKGGSMSSFDGRLSTIEEESNL